MINYDSIICCKNKRKLNASTYGRGKSNLGPLRNPNELGVSYLTLNGNVSSQKSIQ